ncbi:hypothetical protein L1885_16620, partial [Streptomyces fuscigenes]|nr:hypothetical protein [Streptomyces fuscigenes]
MTTLRPEHDGEFGAPYEPHEDPRDDGAFEAVVGGLADPLTDPIPGTARPGGPAPASARHGAPAPEGDGPPAGPRPANADRAGPGRDVPGSPGSGPGDTGGAAPASGAPSAAP